MMHDETDILPIANGEMPQRRDTSTGWVQVRVRQQTHRKLCFLRDRLWKSGPKAQRGATPMSLSDLIDDMLSHREAYLASRRASKRRKVAK